MSFCILIITHSRCCFFLSPFSHIPCLFSLSPLPPFSLSHSRIPSPIFKIPPFSFFLSHPFTIPFLCTYNTHIKLNITTLKTLFDFRIGVSVVSAIVYKCLLHAKMACISPVQHEQVQGTSCATRQRQRE